MGSIIPATHLLKVYIDILANLINNFIINIKYQAIIVSSQNFILKVGATQINEGSGCFRPLILSETKDH